MEMPLPEKSPKRITFSRGFGKYDSAPEQRSSQDPDSFLKTIADDRGKAKGEQWICAPCAVATADALHKERFPNAIGARHRCSSCVLACQWVAFDIDKGLSPAAFEYLTQYLRSEDLQGVLYTTASHTKETPRCRIILILDRPVQRTDRIRVSTAMRARLDLALQLAGFPPITWDESCDRPEQPIYLPLEGCELEPIDGKPLPADVLLAEWQAPGLLSSQRADSCTVAESISGGAGNHPTMLVIVARMIRANLSDAAIQAAVQAESWGRVMPQLEVQRAIDGARAKLRSGEWTTTSATDFEDDGEIICTPESLRRPTSPPDPYPIHALGPLLEPAAVAIKRVIQAPEAVIGGSLLAASSLAVQALADVHIDGRVHPLSLWLLSVAESGERKSAVDAEAMRAGREHETSLASAHVFEMQVYAAELSEWEAKRDAAKSEAKKKKGAGLAEQLRTLGPPPAAPLLPRVMAADFTAEGLFKLLSAGRPTIGAFTDEAALVFGGHGMAKESVMRTAGTLCKLWDSGTLDRVRSGDGALKLYGRRLSMHLLAQPVIAEKALSDDVLAGQGFMARCLLAWPEGTAGSRTYRSDSLRDTPAMQRLTATLLERHRLPLAVGEQQELQPRTLCLAPAAMAEWIRLHDQIEAEMRSDGQFVQVKAWASKTPEQALRIAGVLTLLEDAGATAIELASMQRGVVLARWHLNEALRLAGTAELSPETRDAEALLRWAQTTERKFLYSREVLQYGPSRIRERSAFQRAIGELVRAGWAFPVDGGMYLNKGHRRYVWRMHGDAQQE